MRNFKKRLLALGMALSISASASSMASCSNKVEDIDMLKEKNDAIVDVLSNMVSVGVDNDYRVTGIEGIETDIRDISKESELRIVTDAEVRGNKTNVLFTFKGDKDNIDSMRDIEDTAEKIYTSDDEADLNEYLEKLYDFIDSNKTYDKCNITLNYKTDKKTKDLSLDKDNAIMSKVIAHYASADTIESDKISNLLKKIEEKSEKANFTNKVLVNKKENIATVYSTFDVHTFSVDVKLDTEAQYTEAKIIDMVTKFFNGKEITEDLTISIVDNSEKWNANYHSFVLDHVNESLINNATQESLGLE